MTLYKNEKISLECYGRKFYGNAQTFENQYKQLEVSIDEIAERISKLGGNHRNDELPE
jgi:starvation-inducible DNA-binding protein